MTCLEVIIFKSGWQVFPKHKISDVAAECRSSRRSAAALSTATAADSNTTAAAVESAESFTEEPAERVQGLKLAGQKITQAAAIPTATQQRIMSGSQEDWPRCAKCANASRSRDMRNRDETKQRVQSADRGGHRAAFRHQVDRLFKQVRAGLPALRQVSRRSLQRQHEDQLHSR